MSPTLTGGLPIPSHGARSASSMRSDEVGVRLLLAIVNQSSITP
jgi:hypothetical protein